MGFLPNIILIFDACIMFSWKILWCWLGWNIGRELYFWVKRKLRKDDKDGSK